MVPVFWWVLLYVSIGKDYDVRPTYYSERKTASLRIDEIAMRNNALAQRLKNLRESLGLTQLGLSQALGGDRAPTVSDWENGRKRPGQVTLMALASLTTEPMLVLHWLRSDGPMPRFEVREDIKQMAQQEREDDS